MNHKREDGFTLIELLVSISILGIIMSAISASIIVFLKNSDDTTNRFAESHDAQLASAYFADDVQSSVTMTAVGNNCIAGGNASPVVTRFEWDDPGDVTGTVDDTINIAFYSTETVSDEVRLIRNSCKTGDTAPTSLVMAHFLDPITTPSVSSSSSVVTMTVTEKSGYKYTLTGKKRRP